MFAVKPLRGREGLSNSSGIAAVRPGTTNSKISESLLRAVKSGAVPGVVACAATAEGEIYRGAFGLADTDCREPIREDQLFFIASMTKTVTHVAVMQLVEQGRLSLEDPAAAFVPRLAETQVLLGFRDDGTPVLRPPRRPITVRHLLAYTAGFAYPQWNPDIKRFIDWAGLPDSVSYKQRSLDLPLVSDPGDRWNYGINSEFLGQIVESVTGERLDRYFESHIFGPLGMESTAYVVPADQTRRLTKLHVRTSNDTLSPVQMTLPEDPEFLPGGVGLFSTATDYLSLTRMLLCDGTFNGERLLKPETVLMMGLNQLGHATMAPLRSCDPFWSCDVDLFPGQETQWGLGFLINTQPSITGRSAFSLGWAGACNTFYWIDRSRGVTGVFMTSLVPFCDPRALAAVNDFEASVYAALE